MLADRQLISVGSGQFVSSGGLMTLFLYSPLHGLCHIAQVATVPPGLWEKLSTLLERWMGEALRAMARCSRATGAGALDSAYQSLLADEFLRLLLLRFLFCSLALRLHRAFRTPPPAPQPATQTSNQQQQQQQTHPPRQLSYLPSCHPPLPENELLAQPALQRLLLDMASALNCRHHFIEPASDRQT